MSNSNVFSSLAYHWRVERICALKEVRSDIRAPATNMIVVFVPLNFLILMLLFATSGGQAPTAVVMLDQGPYAQQFLSAMQNAHSFHITPAGGTTADEAQRQIQSGNIVAVVTIPASFDDDLKAGRKIEIPVLVNNLNTDFTNDIRRAIPLTIASFYANAFPEQVVVKAQEVDSYPQDTDYIPYLGVSVLVVALMLGGLNQSGVNIAREYENNTIKELLLSPASRWAIQLGKVIGALAVTSLSSFIVLAVLVFIIGIYPQNWLEVIIFAIVIMPIFGAIGALLGTLLRRRSVVIPLSLLLALPLFFLSGPFGPPSFGTTIGQIIAQFSPTYYGIAAFQHAFHGFTTTPTTTAENLLILVGFAVVAIALSAILLRRTSLSH